MFCLKMHSYVKSKKKKNRVSGVMHECASKNVMKLKPLL